MLSKNHIAVATHKRKIAELARSIRKKYLTLKLGRSEQDESIKKLFKPISEPLQEIVKTSTNYSVKKEEPKVDHNETYGSTQFNPPKTSSPVKPNFISLEEVAATEDNPEEFSENDDEISPTSDQSLAPQVVAQYLEQYPPMSLPVVQDYWQKDDKIDPVYGPVYDEDNDWWFLGNKRMEFESKTGNIKLLSGGNQLYLTPGTPGLYQLIFYDKPVYTPDDLKAYKTILETTNVHRNALGHLKGTQRSKYMQIIRPLFSSREGAGLSKLKSLPTQNLDLIYNEKPIEYVYWDDPNELVDRLKLLVASKQAGNTSQQNEITAIINELKEANIIW